MGSLVAKIRKWLRLDKKAQLTAMLYEVLVVSNGGGGERFTIERDAPLYVGDTLEQDSESYRVLAIQPGHGPFDGVIEAELLGSSGLAEFGANA